MIKNLTIPIKHDDIENLCAGDYVELSGIIYTARDQAHKRLVQDLADGNNPIPYANPVIFYCGPSPEKQGEIIGSAGPTTSSRMDSYTPTLMNYGFLVTIGKGVRNNNVIDAIKKNKGLYFTAFGGCGALYQTRILKKKIIAYPDLLAEAIYELEIKNFPVIVAIDSKGHSIFSAY